MKLSKRRDRRKTLTMKLKKYVSKSKSKRNLRIKDMRSMWLSEKLIRRLKIKLLTKRLRFRMLNLSSVNERERKTSLRNNLRTLLHL